VTTVYKTEIYGRWDPLHWPRDGTLPTKVGTNWGEEQRPLSLSVYFAWAQKTTEFSFSLFICQEAKLQPSVVLSLIHCFKTVHCCGLMLPKPHPIHNLNDQERNFHASTLVLTLKNAVFWNVMPWGSRRNRRFGGSCRLHH
jgi:hypothetical protein